jgi:hypothetical protein
VRAIALVAVMAILLPVLEAGGQPVSASTLVQDGAPASLSTLNRGYRPKISLQAALRIAEEYVASEHINVSNGWLSVARFLLYGDATQADRDKQTSWLFVWNTDRGPAGTHVDVAVSMNGKAMLLPAM